MIGVYIKIKTEQEFGQQTGYHRHQPKMLFGGAGGGALRGAITGPGTSSTGGATASGAPATVAAGPAEPPSEGANADAGRRGRGGGLEIPQVPEDWAPPECPTYLALDRPGPNHECPICGHNAMRWEAQTMPTGFMKPWLRCRRYPCCPFAYSPRRGVLPYKRRRDKRE